VRIRTRAGAVLLSMVASACGGDGAETTTSVVDPTTSSTTTMATTTTTATTQPATTTTHAPTTTTTLAPPPVSAWDGDGVFEISLDYGFEPSSMMTDRRHMSNATTWMFEQMGIMVTDHADAVLTFDLVGNPLSASYQGVGRCYEGAELDATVTLTDPVHEPTEVRVSFTIPPPPTIYASGCVKDLEMVTAYLDAYVPLSILAITELWQGAAVPMHLAYLNADYSNSYLWDQTTAMTAFESIDDDAISHADTAEFLGTVIDLVEYLVETGDNSSQGADVAAQHLLAAYAGVDYGVATIDDVQEWREWLAGWD
jgi:hypothetical protein